MASARVVSVVPDWVARRFVRSLRSGSDTVDAKLHFALLLKRLGGDQLNVERMRADHRLVALGVVGRPIPVGTVAELSIDGPAGQLPARHYAPAPRTGANKAGRPLLVYYHGGGFLAGDLDTVDQICRLLCAHADVHVLSVGYRLAPENPYPAAVEDAEAGFLWAHAHAGQFGADPQSVAVGGDSAGAALAAVVSLRAVARHRDDAKAPVPCVQLLIYPTMHHGSDYPSREALASGYFLEAPDMEWFFDHYVLSGGGDIQDPHVSPLLADDLTGLPTTLMVTAAFDPLRDEAEAYARRLSEAGVPVVLRRAPGMLHGFFNMTGFSQAAHDVAVATAGSLAALMATKA